MQLHTFPTHLSLRRTTEPGASRIFKELDDTRLLSKTRSGTIEVFSQAGTIEDTPYISQVCLSRPLLYCFKSVFDLGTKIAESQTVDFGQVLKKWQKPTEMFCFLT